MNSSDRARHVACAGVVIVAAVVMPATVLAQTASTAQMVSEEQATSDATSTPDAEAGVFRMGDNPSLRLGDHARVDLHARIQADVSLQDEFGVEGDRLGWGNRRVGVSGVLFKRVEFQIERELSVEAPWRDVFADVRVHRALRIQAGHFKVPFSMERTTSAFNLDFIDRAASVADISPGRETGLMLHGRGPRRFFEYEFGVFRLSEPQIKPFAVGNMADPMLTAGRLTVTPGPVRIGIAFTESRLPEGLHDVAGHFDDGGLLSSEEFYVNGRRRRIGIESRWRTGRLTLKGELLRQVDSREGASVSNGDLSDLIVDGGYISGLWRIVGSPRRARRAVDLAVRIESLGIHSADQSDAPSLSPRAEHIAPLRQRALTFGANWLVTRWVKVQFNAIRESFVDEAGIRPEIPEARWRSLMRLQFAM